MILLNQNLIIPFKNCPRGLHNIERDEGYGWNIWKGYFVL